MCCAGLCVLGMVRRRLGQLAWLQPTPMVPTGTQTLEIKEWYQNREDMLELKHINEITGLVIDYFKPGHPQALRGKWIPLPGPLGAQVGPHMLLRAASMKLVCGGRKHYPCIDRVLWWRANSPCFPKQTRCGRSGEAQHMTNVPLGKSKSGPHAHSVVGIRHTVGAPFIGGQDA